MMRSDSLSKQLKKWNSDYLPFLSLRKKSTMNKLGAELAWNTIIILIIALIAAAIIIFIFNDQAHKGSDVAGGYLNNLEADCDRDGVKNAIDECPYSAKPKTDGQCPIDKDETGCPKEAKP